MEISNLGKQLMKAVGVRELKFSSLNNHFSKQFKGESVGAEISLMAQIGLVEEYDGYVSLTDAGLEMIACDGLEIPAEIEKMIENKQSEDRKIKVNKAEPGVMTEAEKEYRAGIAARAALLNDRRGRHKSKPRKPIEEKAEELKEPENLVDVEESLLLTSPLIESENFALTEEEEMALEAAKSISITQDSGRTVCPVFGEIKKLFCEACCEAYSEINTKCTLSDSMAKRLKL